MSQWFIYLLMKMDSFITFFSIVSFASFIATIFLFMGLCDPCKDLKQTIYKYLKLTIPSIFLFLALALFIPTTKQMAAIIIIPKICNTAISNKEFMQLPSDIVSLASEWIKELKPKNIKQRSQ